MAMIGRNAAIAEMGEHRHELHEADRLRVLAGRARLAHDRRPRPHRGVHRLGLGLLLQEPGPQVLDRTDAARIDWGDDEDEDGAGSAMPKAEDAVERRHPL